jgi:hypothetical protein
MLNPHLLLARTLDPTLDAADSGQAYGYLEHLCQLPTGLYNVS